MTSSLTIPDAFEAPSSPERPSRGLVPGATASSGYVYLSVSPSMPDFVEIAVSSEDPRGLKWSVQSMGGVTKFRCVSSWRTSDAEAVRERFHEALAMDQIPNHDDLFKISLRFAQQILAEEVQAFPAPGEAPVARRGSKPYALAGAAALALLVGILAFVRPYRTVAVAPEAKVEQPMQKAVPALRHTAPKLRM